MKSLLVILAITLIPSICYADTLIMKNNDALKGIVIEDYVDRIVYSTIDGEKTILKSEISFIKYDERLDNLIHLGDTAFKKGYYKTALRHYLMAQKIAPDIKMLNNKIYNTEIIIYKTPEILKRKQLEIKNDAFSSRTLPETPPDRNDDDIKKALQEEFGISISRKEDGMFIINALKKDSPFAKGGARKKDLLISIWSKLCGYLTLNDLYLILTKPEEAMLRTIIERTVLIREKSAIDFKLIMKWEGPEISAITKESIFKTMGLKNGDIIVAVNDEPIRYTPLETVLKKLDVQSSEKTVTIHRKLDIFK